MFSHYTSQVILKRNQNNVHPLAKSMEKVDQRVCRLSHCRSDKIFLLFAWIYNLHLMQIRTRSSARGFWMRVACESIHVNKKSIHVVR